MNRGRHWCAFGTMAVIVAFGGFVTTGLAATPNASYDPLAYSNRIGNWLGNLEARVPAQCYTKTGADSNPCYACHTSTHGRNHTDDWNLQEKYDFSDYAKTNHWSNLFVDRRPLIAKISDQQILHYIRQDNYTPLRKAMRGKTHFMGWRPDIDLERGFDKQGFARDGSGWRAFRYKPFLGTFWPTNGSTDDVMIRLPKLFREDKDGRPSREVYKANLAIVVAAMSVPDTVPAARLTRKIEPIDETAIDLDLNGDGHIVGVVTTIRGLPRHYVGAASRIPVVRFDYPVGTEFLHTVRYVDPDSPNFMSTRLKELRYMVKFRRFSPAGLDALYAEAAREQKYGLRDHFNGNAKTGLTNGFGWKLQGYIEDREGRLRLQTREEQSACLGCHGGIGVTVDSTFALPRKVPGATGWGHEDIAGIADVPATGNRLPEILNYFERVHGGDEFRANTEVLQRFFAGGVLDKAKVLRAGRDIRHLILPSPARALALDKAYLTIVHAQSFTKGRDANLAPTVNVHHKIEDTVTALKASDHVYKNYRLWLDWHAKVPSE